MEKEKLVDLNEKRRMLFEENGEWYFWNETWFDKHGPYPSRVKAEEELTWYMVETLGI